MSGYVFISYSRRDRPYVELLDTHLAGAGVAVWFDERIEYGQAWTAEISDKLDNCAAVLVIMTPESARSEWVDREITYARQNHKPVIPLLLRDTSFLALSTNHYYDVRGDRMPGPDLITVLRALVDPLRGGAGTVAEIPRPRSRILRPSDVDDCDNRLAYVRARPVFIQYLNPEILACYGLTPRRGYGDHHLTNALHATRLAVLATDDSLVFPASYFKEAHEMPAFLAHTSTLAARGRLQYTSNTDDLDEYFAAKRAEYRADENNPYTSRTDSLPSTLRWRPRRSTSTANDIACDWRRSVQDDGSLGPTVRSLYGRWSSTHGNLSTVLEAVPDQLDGQAFIERFVERYIPIPLRAEERKQIALFLSRSYLVSYLEDLDANLLADFEFGDLSCWVGKVNESLAQRVLSARRFDTALAWVGLDRFVHY
ncbi:MAG: toll/interleukin-1 receptor domain-containing protein, partial [Dactylosporangium sp.]|nr:toll/interleukin-1 receptor domain-containing protein [Dactylosporangium sp.]